MRKMIFKDLKNAAISRVVIERPHKKCLVTIHSGRPGLIIGKKGSEIENLRKKLQKHNIPLMLLLILLKLENQKLMQHWLLKILPNNLKGVLVLEKQ